MNAGSSNRRYLGLAAIVLAFATFLGVNLFARETGSRISADLTEDRLYTISENTREVLREIDEPIVARLYFSRRMGEIAPAFAAYFDRVRALLDQYADLSGGRLVVETFDPEPFTDAEDRAVAAGLQGVPLGSDNTLGYFGIVATNSTDDQETIPFLAFERESFLEYDLTRMVHKLADPARKTVGLITTLPISGGMNPMTGPQPAWQIVDQIREFFEIEDLGSEVAEIPEDVDVLMLVQPAGLDEKTLFAIDQFVLKGGPTLVFADPITEVAGPQGRRFSEGDRFLDLLGRWGVAFNPDRVAGDLDHSRRVQYGPAAQPTVASYLVWLIMGRDTFDAGDPLFASISQLAFATAGVLEPAAGVAAQPVPLVETSTQSMAFPVEEVREPDPPRLLHQFQPSGQHLPVVVRVRGPAETAYPDGAPRDENGEEVAAEDGEAAATSGEVNLMVVADADMLYDSFWADVREIFGTRFLVPQAGNADMVLNALQDLSGGTALSGLRGRGVAARPFTLVEDIGRAAEARYREHEQALSEKLKEVQAKIDEIERNAEGAQVILAEEDKAALTGFRREMIEIRQELRDVQRALRQDVDRLDGWLKFANIAAVPILIAVAGAVGLTVRRRRHGARRSQ